MAEKQAINQKVKSVFNFSISQQTLIDWQDFLLCKCVCSNWNSDYKAILIIWNAWMKISHKTSLNAKFDIEDLTILVSQPIICSVWTSFLKLPKCPEYPKIALIQPSHGICTWPRSYGIHNVELKTLVYFLSLSLTMTGGIWSQYS